MRRLTSEIALTVVFATCCILGCGESAEQKLGLSYRVPTVPSDLKRFFRPLPDEKAIEELRDGETKIDMHEYYFGFHRSGWDHAIDEHHRNPNKRQFKSVDDVHMTIQAMKIGCDAYWSGYDDAYRQIGAASKNR